MLRMNTQMTDPGVLDYKTYSGLPDRKRKYVMDKKYTIAVAGTGYVGLPIVTLLSQHHWVYAVDIIPEKVELINQRKSSIQDGYIEKYLQKRTWILPQRLTQRWRIVLRILL